MKLSYIKQAGEPNGDAGDQYTGLDRFGRVVDQRWPQGSTELERVKYGFTPASNRQWRQNLVAAGGQDQYYNYDGLYQVKAANQGTLNSTKTGIAGTPARTEDFTYDPIGNWNNYLTKVSGVTDLDQDRTHNTANQTTEIDGSPATVAHDPAGNMTKVPQVADWASTNELRWDAWNRLVKVQDGSTTVAEYAYDALTRRIKKTMGGTIRRYYYSTKWQILEERLNAATTAERQFVWGLRYPDDLVLRIRGSERLYVLSDYFNPTAIADEAGTVLERYGYDTFGQSRVMTPDFEPRSGSDYDWETRFHAYRYDAETGLYQVRYRYLHPTLGRWPSRDPIAERGGLNLYGFVDNNPVNWVDHFGRAPMSGGSPAPFPPFIPPGGFPRPNPDDDETSVPPVIDGLLKRGLEATMNSCFWRCYLLDLSDDDVQQMLNEIQDSAPLEERQFFQDWIAGIPGAVGAKFIGVASTVHNLSARIPQGQGIVGGTLHRITPRDATVRLIRRKVYQQSVRAVGSSGTKYFGRFGSKLLPLVGWVSLGYEAAKACSCNAACKDGVFSDDEKFIGQ